MPDVTILECVPNFSEGRDSETIQKIASAAKIGGVHVLDLHSDRDHNRSVLTLIGTPSALVEAAVSIAGAAIRSVDLRAHKGVHPRLGSIDVIPFVPLKNSDLHYAIDAAFTCARRVSSEFDVPCFLFGFAALRRHAQSLDLPAIRANAFELLTPDFGGPDPHPSAGATVVGTRRLLVAFNIELATRDVRVAKEIAEAIRERSGGLEHVRALGFQLDSKGTVQVSTNLLRPEKTTMASVYDRVTELAFQMRVEVVGAELVGLAPKSAFGGRDPGELRLKGAKILEDELEKHLGKTERPDLI